MAHGVRHAHAVLAQEPELRVPLGVAGGQHAALAGGDDLAGVEGEAGDVPVGLADGLPAVADADLAADGAGGVLDDRQAVPARRSP